MQSALPPNHWHLDHLYKYGFLTLLSHFSQINQSSFYKSLKIIGNCWTTFSILPLRISTIVGFMMATVSCIIALILVIWKILFGYSSFEGWTTIILGILIIGGIQLTGIGVVGEYIGRLYMNINKMPQYTIEKVLNLNSKSNE